MQTFYAVCALKYYLIEKIRKENGWIERNKAYTSKQISTIGVHEWRVSSVDGPLHTILLSYIVMPQETE